MDILTRILWAIMCIQRNNCSMYFHFLLSMHQMFPISIERLGMILLFHCLCLFLLQKGVISCFFFLFVFFVVIFKSIRKKVWVFNETFFLFFRGTTFSLAVYGFVLSVIVSFLWFAEFRLICCF